MDPRNYNRWSPEIHTRAINSYELFFLSGINSYDMKGEIPPRKVLQYFVAFANPEKKLKTRKRICTKQGHFLTRSDAQASDNQLLFRHQKLSALSDRSREIGGIDADPDGNGVPIRSPRPRAPPERRRRRRRIKKPALPATRILPPTRRLRPASPSAPARLRRRRRRLRPAPVPAVRRVPHLALGSPARLPSASGRFRLRLLLFLPSAAWEIFSGTDRLPAGGDRRARGSRFRWADRDPPFLSPPYAFFPPSSHPAPVWLWSRCCCFRWWSSWLLFRQQAHLQSLLQGRAQLFSDH